ncbi:DNA polymerase Y family protein [Nocardioides sp. GY 10113]|uniref:Y-family DNA polymerase n=1 Tax=Nocardioides sp. GY 10113 TaxID=2569761 RepID=UPI0010A8167C|nr:DNA polymerase Y family protein [Nocardioides sp. GY 10113]TIC79613.1 DNA polymerase Y family protein [Nocardioides sp. GY 10113]TIC79640.1 DNA polymerase Y family protein [Nocardioides sp. GY 10113]
MARVLVLWCPDWSVTAALMERAEAQGDGGAAEVVRSTPAAVLSANRVVVCNAAARAEGVRRGQRRRDAQARCPELLLLAAGPERDARWFEPVLAAVEEIRPGVAPIRPGLLAVSAPGRFHGGEEAAAALLAEELVARGVWDCRMGVADDLYSAERAARRAPAQGCTVVPPGGSAAFLRELPITALTEDGEEGRRLVDLLRRLGLVRLGEFAAFGADEVSNRFGAYGADLLRRVRGEGTALAGARTPPPELACEIGFEPPLDSAEAVTFSVRTTAERFVAGLAERQLVATAVRIEAVFDAGAVAEGEGGMSSRTWVHPRCFTSRDLVDRVHWQLQAGAALRSRKEAGAVTAPIERVRFLPETVESAGDHADGLWGGGAEEQVVRGVARVQAMLGYDAVRVPVLQGGRGAADRQAWVTWGERSTGLRPTLPPWPGRIPGPAPTRVFPAALVAEVLDADGDPVAVTERGAVSGAPYRYRVEVGGAPGARGWRVIAGWAGPWPVDEGWWTGAGPGGEEGGRSARFQVVGLEGDAWLLRWRPSGWEAEAAYD